jgi:hypothetical protein
MYFSDTRGIRVRRLLGAAALALLGAACTDDRSLTEPDDAVTSLNAQGRPFYYYFGEQVALDVDPAEISVVSTLPPEASARAVLATLGVRVRGAQALPHAANHWLLQLDGADADRAAGAARALRADARFGFAANVYRVAGQGSRVVLLDRVAVRMKDGWTRADLARLNALFGTRVVREPVEAEPNVVWLAYKRGGDPLELAAQLHQHPLVEWADPDKVQDRERFYLPTDPYFAQQYYARNTVNTLNGVRVDIAAEYAWDLSHGAWSAAAGPLLVAVVDDGVELSHPDINQYDWGYDAFSGTFQWPGCTSCSVNPGHNYSHGTLVAGVIRANHNNGIGLSGIAPAATIMPIRIFDGSWAASDNQIAQALNTAWYNGAQVMNNSWGGGAASTAITSAIGRAVTEGRGGKGTVMVFAAGNTSNRGGGIVGAVSYPGSLSNVLTVGAINRSGGVTNYSPDGAALDVVAPSGHTTGSCIGDVVSTDLTSTRGCNDGPGGDINYSSTFSGTSAAAPQAAAVAAMVLSRNAALTELQVRDQIKAGADPWGTANTFGSGKLNAYRALVGRVAMSITGISFASTEGEYTWTANATGGSGSYTYLWEKSYDGVNFFTVGSARTYAYWVYPDDEFTLRATVWDGPDQLRLVRTKLVHGPSSTTCTTSTTTTQTTKSALPPPPVC